MYSTPFLCISYVFKYSLHCLFERFSTGGLIGSARRLPGRWQQHIAANTRTMKALLFLTCCSVDIWLCACRTVHPTGKAVPGILACLYLHSVLCIHPDPPCPASVTHKGFCHSCPWELPRQQSNDSSLLLGCLYLWGEHSPLQEAAVKLFENYPCLVPVAPLKFPNVTKEIRPGR